MQSFHAYTFTAHSFNKTELFRIFRYISTFLLTDLVFLLFVVAISFLLLESYDHLLFSTVQHSSAVMSNDAREPM